LRHPCLSSSRDRSIPDRAVVGDAAAFVQLDPFHKGAPRSPFNIASEKSSVSVLPITGQGTIAIRTTAKAGLKFTVNGGENTSLVLHITTDAWDLYSTETGSPTITRIPAAELKDPAAIYLNAGLETTYWLSMDNDNGILR
jgi:hypothetical protein